MAQAENIKLGNLLINTENYRFEIATGQKEAIDSMIENQNDKLHSLVLDILVNGLSPVDLIQVTQSKEDKTKYIVLEGNRRITALKLLDNPNLIDNPKYLSLKKKFKKTHEENKTKIPKILDCTVFKTPAEADKWIKRKHAGQLDGVGTVDWNSQQIQRFEEKVEGKSSIALQAINLLKSHSSVPQSIKDNLLKLPITNFDRLLSDPDVREFLCLDNNNGVLQSDIDEIEVVKGLTQVAKDLLKPSFTVNDIYYKKDREIYINKFPKDKIPSISKKASKPWTLTKTSNPTSGTNYPKAKPNPKDRNRLIPKTCSLKISNAKVNSIYHELQSIDIAKFTNAVAVLYRVFIELSVDTYIEEHGLVQTPSAAKSGVDFQQKINVVANHMDNKKFADAAICKGIKAAIKDKNDILGIDTWHAYVHNNRFAPKANNLSITWDNMQEFVIILWNNIK